MKNRKIIPLESLDKKMYEHSEIKEGEVFLGNLCLESYKNLLYRSKRKGEPINNNSDGIIENMLFPVFVSKFEYYRYKY